MSNFVEGRIYLDRLIDPAVPASGHHMVNLFGWAVLVAWCVVPVLLGYWRFERADFGWGRVSPSDSETALFDLPRTIKRLLE